MFKLKNIIIAFGLLIIDLAIYLFLGLMMMGYEDFYDESKGPWYSLESMTTEQKFYYISLEIWNVLNLLIIAYFLYRLFRIIKKKRLNYST